MVQDTIATMKLTFDSVQKDLFKIPDIFSDEPSVPFENFIKT